MKKENLKARYALGVYQPKSKSAKPITYKGVEYLSKIQCIVLNDLTMKELNEYLKNA